MRARAGRASDACLYRCISEVNSGMVRHRSSKRRRSNTLSASGRTDSRSIGWRSVLVAAPLVYGAGVLVGDLLAVAVGAPLAVVGSGIGVVAACVLVSVGLSRLIDRLRRTEPRSLGSIASPQTSIRTGMGVLIPAFFLGFGLAVLA